jgi:cell division protein FtsQ
VRPKRSKWWFSKPKNRRVEVFRTPLHDRIAPVLSQLATRLGNMTRFWIFGGVLIVLVAMGGFARAFILHSKHFAVRNIRISATRHVAASSLRARVESMIGKNLFRVSLEEIRRVLAQEPWVASLKVRRELPGTIAIEITEREPRALVALGVLYLSDQDGAVFKRATPDETAGLPVITGIERDRYLSEPENAKSDIRETLQAARAWREVSGAPRPAIGEIHFDRVLGVTVYTTSGVAVRLGRINDSVSERLRKFDMVWSALASSGEKPRIIYLDNRARTDRVTVKLAQAITPVQSEGAAGLLRGADQREGGKSEE